jgi:hypothetical protein
MAKSPREYVNPLLQSAVTVVIIAIELWLLTKCAGC